MSARLVLLDLWLRLTEKPYLARERDAARARARLEAMAARNFRLPSGCRVETAPMGQVAGERVHPPGGQARGVLLWFHGGAYCLGSPASHRHMAAAVAAPAGAEAWLPDYRLAPEHPFPAAIEDAVAAYRHALETVAPQRLAIGGDSAGGGLAFGLLHAITRAGLPGPACAIAFSPWADMTLSGPSIRRLRRRDAILPAGRLAEIRDTVLAGADPADPRISPVFGAFRDPPPCLIQASLHEILLDDARNLAARLHAAGAPVRLELSPRVPHVWQAFHRFLPEARAAIASASAFLEASLPENSADIPSLTR